MSGVWVWVEHQDDEIAAIGRELIGAGRTAADGLGEQLTAVLFGSEISNAAQQAFNYGADAVIAADNPILAKARVEANGPLLAKLANERQPSVLMAGSTNRGRDIAAWVAAELDAGLVADGIGFNVDGERVKVTRPVYAGKLLAEVFVIEGLQVITLRSRAFAPAESTGKSGEVEWIQADLSEDDIRSQVLAIESASETVSLGDANVIVSGGRGVGGPEGFDPIKALAEAVGGAVGASRAAVDAGWIPYDYQVGQTGKTVSPDLYFACGISGAIQHQAGMRTSKVIVAINKDQDAPIFKLASYGIVGDLFQIVPALTAEFNSR